MKKMMIRVGTFFMLVSLLLAGTIVYQPAFAQEQERGILFTATYPHLVVPLDKSEVEFSLTLTNTGKRGEEVLLRVDSAPEGWGFQFRSI